MKASKTACHIRQFRVYSYSYLLVLLIFFCRTENMKYVFSQFALLDR